MQELLDQQFDKAIDIAGAGATWSSPGWLTQLNQLWGGKSVRLVLVVPVLNRPVSRGGEAISTAPSLSECTHIESGSYLLSSMR